MCATRAKSICRHAACGKAIEAPGYCEKHQKDATGWNRSHGDKSASERGYGWAWKKLRDRIMQRDYGLCQPHIRQGIVKPAHEVDHKIPKAQGGTDDEPNLEAICTECHRAKTAAERGQAA